MKENSWNHNLSHKCLTISKKEEQEWLLVVRLRHRHSASKEPWGAEIPCHTHIRKHQQQRRETRVDMAHQQQRSAPCRLGNGAHSHSRSQRTHTRCSSHNQPTTSLSTYTRMYGTHAPCTHTHQGASLSLDQYSGDTHTYVRTLHCRYSRCCCQESQYGRHFASIPFTFTVAVASRIFLTFARPIRARSTRK